ncbi:response regulator [Paragemmobacter straminiformis]|uniref:Response regulator n=1 Tax=Paragemmobacter straminiformis TaxID=2045119 RepID=A0A842IC90_9RHOB|nr:response regulator [Gemmobacter straminiformis]MBC2836734.1 response regulator [Gemmobacter straminiformis]
MTLRVLAVDDSLTMREMLRAALSAAGFDVTLAEDGLDALDRLAEAAPDLIVTDLNMPRMDGFGFIEAVRAGDTAARVPILILTTETGAKLKDRARAIGATGWITKPFDEGSLVATINRVAAV